MTELKAFRKRLDNRGGTTRQYVEEREVLFINDLEAAIGLAILAGMTGDSSMMNELIQHLVAMKADCESYKAHPSFAAAFPEYPGYKVAP
jgi:hypothetical protein